MKKLVRTIMTAAALYFSTAATAQTWSWATQSSGTGIEYGNGVATDGSGNNYVAGSYINNPAVFGTYTLAPMGNGDGYLARYTSAGAPVWAVRMAGTLYDYGRDVVVDAGANIFVSGTYRGSMVLYSTSATSITLTGSAFNDNCFLAKYNSSGVVQWAITYGNPATSWDLAISPSQQRVFMSGEHNGQMFAACYSYSTAPIAPLWTVTCTTSSGNSQGFGIAADNSGNSYVLANYTGPTITGTLSTGYTFSGNNGMLLMKLSPTGSASWVTNIGNGTTGMESGRGIELDATGNIYIGGQYSGTANISGTSLASAGSYDVFVAKYSNAGSIQWARRMGGPGTTGGDLLNGFTVSPAGDSYLFTVNNDNNNVPFGCKTYPAIFGNNDNKMILAKYNTQGLMKGSAAPFLDNNSSYPASVSLDASGNAILTGHKVGAFSAGSFTLAAGADMFLTKVTIADELPVVASTSVNICGLGASTTLSASGPAGSTIKWYNSALSLVSTGTSYNTPASGAYSSVIYYVSSTVAGCESEKLPITVTTLPNNQISVTPTNTTICNGSCITVNFTNATTAVLTPGGTIQSSPFVFCPTAGNQFTLTNTAGGYCEVPGTFSVNVIITPAFAGTYSASIGTATSCTPAVTGTSKPISTSPVITNTSMPTSTVITTFRCQLANTMGWMGARSVGISDFTFIGTYTVEVYEVDNVGVRNVISGQVAPNIYQITGTAPFTGNLDFNDPVYCVGYDPSAGPYFVDPTPGIGDYFFEYYREAANSLPSTTALTAYSAKIFCADVRQVTSDGCTINKKSYFRIANNGNANGRNGRMAMDDEEETEDSYHSLEIYPNPTNGIVYIPLTNDDRNVQVIVTDNIGRQVLKSNNLENSHGQLNMTELPAGIYFYTILKNNTPYKGKIIKH